MTRHEDQRAILADPRFSNNVSRDGHPTQSPGIKAQFGGGLPFIVRDEPEHQHHRRMFTAHFAVKRVSAMRPRIEWLVGELLDSMEEAGPPADLVSTFALPLSSLVISELLGVPYEDHAFFQRASEAIAGLHSTGEQAASAGKELAAYLDQLISVKEREPQQDLLSSLTAEQVRTGRLTRAELVENALLLLAAGHESTANMVALGTLALLRHPDQLAHLRDSDDPARVELAVEELLRYLTVAQSGGRRVALEDVDVAGRRIRAGEGVILANDAANRDEEVFEDPDRLDLERSNARRHMAFGYGAHQCLGANLARAELQIAYPALLRRFPRLRTAVPDDQLRFRDEMLVYGVHELPVTW